ncbi:N-acetyllactosaminide 3-alpha-galactosyltransferase [Cooperia oncophora]
MVFHQQYCPMARFLMKVDDDVSVHLDRMIELWKMNDKANMSIFCQVWPKSKPQREPESKWFVPQQMWPERFFPPYCNGPMYVMGKTAGQTILDHSQVFIPMTIEDLFYTGVVADSTGVKRINWGKSMMYSAKDLFRGRYKCSASEIPTLFSVHSLWEPDRLRQGFHIMKTYECGTPRLQNKTAS